MQEEKPWSTSDAPAPSFVRFGPYELDLRSAELRKNDLRIRLQDQPFRILVALLKRPGEVVTREEIRRMLWPDDTVVEFDHSINAAVKRLRDALRESAEKPRYIETLARRGYRFISEVEKVSGEAAGEAANQPIATPFVVSPRADFKSGEMRPFLNGLARPSRLPLIVPVLLATLILAALAGRWHYRRGAPARWAKEVALPEVSRFVNAGDFAAAFPLVYRALEILPREPALNRLRRQMSYPTLISTTPSGASIYVKAYASPDSSWVYLGQSPLENFLLPAMYFRWRVAKPGFQTVEGAAGIQGPSIEFILDREGSVPLEMVHVPRASFRLFGGAPVELDDFWMDKYEITNRQFRDFVINGGYRSRQYWRERFIKDGRVLTWEQAMAGFRDATGQPGPSTWEVSDYPPGHDDLPVSGVSWYEAAAYAEFAKKGLPTVYHWYRAASQGIYSDILYFSNFDGNGPVRVGSRMGIGAFGTYDMAGNVREWCLNAMGGRRYILGGASSDGRAYYVAPDALSPFDRSPANGFRCVKYPNGAFAEALSRPVEDTSRDYRKEKPVSDSVFRILRRFYSYDRTDLRPVRESVDESSPYWRAEKITFDAAYDHQRVIAWLYLPKNSRPPYQTVIYYPAGIARAMGHIDVAEVKRIEFLIRSGRAVLFPVYQGTYERRPANLPGPSGAKDIAIQQCKDFQRSVDYLGSRSDIAHDRLGFFGISDGATRGAIALAVEGRIKAAVLAEAGLSTEVEPPEIDVINFVPRVRIPVLMLSGRYDFGFLLETNLVPMFNLFATPQRDKRHVLFESGHTGPIRQYIKETLDWFDRYLGPVNR